MQTTHIPLQLMAGAFLMLFGCSDIMFTMDGYKRAVRSGFAKIPEARQFDEVFGKENVDHFIGYSGNRNNCTWTSCVCFGGRYELAMQVTVRLNRPFDEVLEVIGEPEFYMVEIQRVEDLNGRIGASMAPDFERNYGHFDREKWREIYKSKGDFSAAGIPLKNATPPVPDFEKYVAGGRRDRIQVER